MPDEEAPRRDSRPSASPPAPAPDAPSASGLGPDAFRRAIESWDVPEVLRTLAPDVVLHSPIGHHPYVGREAVGMLLTALMQIFVDFRYVAEYAAPDGRALVFRTRVGDKELEGADFITFGDDGLVRDFTVMVRPYSAATALREAMAARLATHNPTP